MTSNAQLIAEARKARIQAYAPYSNFAVGAAILTKNGEVFVGCNVENASFGLTICAERVAATTAVAAGQRDFVRMALSLPESGSPCGACRQFLSEFCDDMEILIDDSDREDSVRETTLAKLLPDQFSFEV